MQDRNILQRAAGFIFYFSTQVKLLTANRRTNQQAQKNMVSNFQRDNIKGESYKKADKKFNTSSNEVFH